MVAQVGKAGLAHHPLAHHAAGQAHGFAGFLLRFQVRKLRLDVGRVGILGVFCALEGVAPRFLQIFELVAAHGHQLVIGLFGELLSHFGRLVLHFIWLHRFILPHARRGADFLFQPPGRLTPCYYSTKTGAMAPVFA